MRRLLFPEKRQSLPRSIDNSSGAFWASTALVAFASAALGSLFTHYVWWFYYRSFKRKQRFLMLDDEDPEDDNNDEQQQQHTCLALEQARARRRRLPRTIILVRHGESEGNADQTVWQRLPDNLLGLTAVGRTQASAIGRRIESILQKGNCRTVHLVVSPFERTLQTATQLRKAFERRIVRTDIESRIREQEMGNLQGSEFTTYRREQQKVGRFFYRFPTGESGADVLDRVKSWWYESVLGVNLRVGFDRIDAMVVVTHGLTLRFVLMQLFGWSPTTFHSVWNAQNCDIYVLQKDLSKPGNSPYVLDKESGDVPRSSIDVMVELSTTNNDGSNTTEQRILKLENYLSVPPPRTTRIRLVKRMLAQQYNLDESDMGHLVFMPFVEGGVIKGRSTSGVASSPSTPNSSRHNASVDLEDEEDSDYDDEEEEEANDDGLRDRFDLHPPYSTRRSRSSSNASWSPDGAAGGQFNRYARKEVSGRFPCIKL